MYQTEFNGNISWPGTTEHRNFFLTKVSKVKHAKGWYLFLSRMGCTFCLPTTGGGLSDPLKQKKSKTMLSTTWYLGRQNICWSGLDFTHPFFHLWLVHKISLRLVKLYLQNTNAISWINGIWFKKLKSIRYHSNPLGQYIWKPLQRPKPLQLARGL